MTATRFMLIAVVGLISCSVNAIASSDQIEIDKDLRSFASLDSNDCSRLGYAVIDIEIEAQQIEANAELQIAENRQDRVSITRNLAELRNAGLNRIRLADVLADRHCLVEARQFYISVIEQFQGASYAAIRQRAQIGIDDLRAARPKRPR